MEMLQNFQSAVKFKAILVFILVHVGLALGVYALADSAFNGWTPTATLYLAGIASIYIGFVLAVFFILWPLLPWLKRAKQAETWVERILKDLPTFLEHLPKIIAAINALRAGTPVAQTPVENPKSPGA